MLGAGGVLMGFLAPKASIHPRAGHNKGMQQVSFPKIPERLARHRSAIGKGIIIVVSIFVGLLFLGLVLSLFYNPAPSPQSKARQVAEQYFQAHKSGDGAAYCRLLSAESRHTEEEAYDGARRDTTCIQAHSDQSPTLTKSEQQETREIRQQIYKTLKIVKTKVQGNNATIHFSFVNPTPIALGGTPSRYEGLIDPQAIPAAGQGELARDTLSLIREKGTWKVALAEPDDH